MLFRSGIDWSTDFPDDLPPLTGKRNEFGQIALNLILNAAQAVEGVESPAVQARARTVPPADGQDGPGLLLIEVIDNGCGIPETIRDSIFDIFFTTRETRGGSGIGLAITRHLVASMGGRIAVESVVGSGTTFRLTFPLTGETVEAPSADR